MSKPQVVVFDLGKVLVDFDYGIAAQRFSRRSKIAPSEIRSLIDHAPLLYKFETGLLTNQVFYEEICKLTGFNGTFEEFCSIFADIFTPIEPMIEIQARLRQAGVPTYIFSNTNELAVTWIRERFPFFSNFSGYVYSYQEGAMKPEAKIYEVVEKMTGKKGAEILYLDDRPENVAGGAVRGWHTIQHHDPVVTIKKIADHGLI